MKNGRKVLIIFMKKLLCLLMAIMIAVSLFVSCGSGASIAIGALRLDNEVMNLFRFAGAVAYDETLHYFDKDGNSVFTAEYYYEVAEDIYAAYNLVETIGDYKLYAYEGAVYTETEKGITSVLLLSGTYLDFVKRYLEADFIFDGDVLIQRSAETRNDVIYAQYETSLTPQQHARVAEFGVKEDDKILSEYAVRDSIIESVSYSVEREGEVFPVAARTIRVMKEKENRFSGLDVLWEELVTIDFTFVGDTNQGRRFEVPKGVFVGMETGNFDYAFFRDPDCTIPYSFDEEPITENMTIYVLAK